ncbi:MAG: thermonuclease family protein [Deltaproteobacteria bacterium]|nr:thermonuclease family protein [Deltaproteobacteria bacterium]
MTRIIDGDSVVVKRGEKYIEIRLYGIDSPEWKQHSSGMSREFIKNLIYKKKVRVISLYHDSYGRLVALIEHDGQDINGDMIKAGMAWVYPKYCRKTVCREWSENQVKAKNEGRGLWSEDDPLSPWQWKRMHHR